MLLGWFGEDLSNALFTEGTAIGAAPCTIHYFFSRGFSDRLFSAVHSTATTLTSNGDVSYEVHIVLFTIDWLEYLL